MFDEMRELFQILNDARRRRGSIDFDLNEAEVIIDEGGVVEAIIALQRNVAHRLIEEFMLLANETVASALEAQAAPALYRVHEEPDILKVAKFEEFISGFGYSLGVPLTAVRPRHFQKLLERIHGKPEEKPIAFLMLRTMQKARYAPENLGHFGLAASSYTHFTSPIRRYPDLVVHRALRAARHGLLTDETREEWTEELPEIARHTSEMERRADDAERELLQWKKVKFMADKVGDEFEGYVTGVAAFGLFIELIEHFVEGLVHVSTMADDYYRFVEGAHMLRGENTQKDVSAGRQGEGAGDPRQHGRAADRPRARRDPRTGARGRTRAAPKQGHTQTGKASRTSGAERARDGQAGKGAALAGVLRLVVGVLHLVLEILDGAADPAPDVGQPVGAKDDEDDREDDEELRQSNTSHGATPAAGEGEKPSRIVPSFAARHRPLRLARPPPYGQLTNQGPPREARLERLQEPPFEARRSSDVRQSGRPSRRGSPRYAPTPA